MKVKKSSISAFLFGGISGIVMTLVVVSVLIGQTVTSQEWELEAKKRDLEAKMSAKGKVVYAIKDVLEGAEIPTDALEEKEIEQSKIPQDAITSSSLARGRVAKYGISQGQIVSIHDLAPMRLSSY